MKIAFETRRRFAAAPLALALVFHRLRLLALAPRPVVRLRHPPHPHPRVVRAHLLLSQAVRTLVVAVLRTLRLYLRHVQV